MLNHPQKNTLGFTNKPPCSNSSGKCLVWTDNIFCNVIFARNIFPPSLTKFLRDKNSKSVLSASEDEM